MNLRTKLLLSYLLFIVALIALGGWSAWRLRQMGEVSRQIIAQNYDSVVAAQVMKEALERVDSATVFYALGEENRALQQMNENMKRFDQALLTAFSNITETGERRILNHIDVGRREHYVILDQFINREGALTAEAQNKFYFDQIEPRFRQLLKHCDDLLQLNQTAMQAKSRAAEAVARRWFMLTLLLAGVLAAAGIALAFTLARKIARPLAALTEATAKIAGGDLNARAEIISHDEIGKLAAEFNRMAERIRQLRRSDLGQLVVAQQTAEAAIDSLADPALITDAEARVIKLNPAAARLFRDKQQLLPRPINELLPDERDAAMVHAVLRPRAASQGKSQNQMESLVSAVPLRLNGDERAYRLRATPMHADDGALLGAFIRLEDISHLGELDRFKSEFVTTAAEQLQTPLRNVQLGLHALLAEVEPGAGDARHELLYDCRANAEQLEATMHDLIELSRIESGEQRPELKPVALNALLEGLAEELRLQAEAKELTFTAELEANLPTLRLDRAQLVEVIKEMADNALRHTPRGGAIRLAAGGQDYVTIALTDTGRGIPAEFLPRIFHRFVRVPGAPAGKTGLGLAIAKRLIEAQGGQLSVQSEAGRGSTFTIAFVRT